VEPSGDRGILMVKVMNSRFLLQLYSMNSYFIWEIELKVHLVRVFPLFTCQDLTVSTPIAIHHAGQNSSETFPCGVHRFKLYILFLKVSERSGSCGGTERYATGQEFNSERRFNFQGACRSRLRTVLFRWGSLPGASGYVVRVRWDLSLIRAVVWW